MKRRTFLTMLLLLPVAKKLPKIPPPVIPVYHPSRVFYIDSMTAWHEMTLGKLAKKYGGGYYRA